MSDGLKWKETVGEWLRDHTLLSDKQKSKGRSLRFLLGLLFAVGVPSLVMAQDYPPNGPTIPTVSLGEVPPGGQFLNPPPPGPWDQQSAWNMQLVGYADVQGRAIYQPVIVNQGGRYIAYLGLLNTYRPATVGFPVNPLTGLAEANGTAIVDVTDPANPVFLHHIPGPPSIPLGGAQMVRLCSGDVLPHGVPGKWYLLRPFGNNTGAAATATQQIYDVSDPTHPTLLSTIVTHLSNTHKNWWECDTGIAYLVANNPAEGWHQSGSNQHLKIYDLSDPAHPVYIRDFGLLGQQPGATSYVGLVNPPPGIHGAISAGTAKNRVYAAYGVGSNGLLQILDRHRLLTDFVNPTTPTTEEMLAPQVGLLTMSPDQGGHTSWPVLGVPIPGQQGYSQLRSRDFVLLTSEGGSAFCQEAQHMSFMVDVTDDRAPFPVSTLHVPENPEDPKDLCHKGAVSAHASWESFYPPYYGKVVCVSWWAAGLQCWDIRNPFNPQRLAYFIPALNANTFLTSAGCATINGQTVCRTSIETANVELDDRGLIYSVDRAGAGMHILRFSGQARHVVEGD